MYCRYSSSVVAPMHCSSPRASAGFRRFAASMPPPSPPPPPPLLPAPTSVCTSSITRITCRLLSVTSCTTARSRSSKSPRYLVPANSRARSSCSTRLPLRVGGTRPAAMSCARPCAMEVLPTPASPTSTGLFFERRPRMRTVRSSCCWRPTSGSNFPSTAAFVRSSAYFNVSVSFNLSALLATPAAMLLALLAVCGGRSLVAASSTSACPFEIRGSMRCRSASGVVQPRRCPRSFAPGSSSFMMIACSRWAVVTSTLSSLLAQRTASSRICFAPWVKGISAAWPPAPRPTSSWSAARALCSSTPKPCKAEAPTSLPSAKTPTTSISVPT
mmetsp:Transcript_39450/g.125406  ORF Transcript_39450/g.125406 Transcript_39450/m.125406 type:complete len:329 (+) Transcript_39450:1991-2977(+)